MTYRTPLFTFIALAAALATQSAVAEIRPGFYAGAGLGIVDVEDDTVGFDDGDTGFKVFGGYQLGDIVSVEVSYIDGGTAEETAGAAKLEVDTSIVNLSVLGDLLLTEQFSLFGRLGYAFIDTDADFSVRIGNMTVRASDSDSDNEVSYGIGGVYRFTEQLEVRAEFEAFDVSNGDLNAITASVLFRF